MAGGVVVVLLLCGAPALVVVVLRRVRAASRPTAAQSARATGVVVDVETRTRRMSVGGPTVTLHHPVVRFTDRLGREVVVRSQAGWSGGPRQGDTVDLSYDPAHPEGAVLDHRTSPVLGCAVAVVVAGSAVTGLVGVGLLVVVLLLARSGGG